MKMYSAPLTFNLLVIIAGIIIQLCLGLAYLTLVAFSCRRYFWKACPGTTGTALFNSAGEFEGLCFVLGRVLFKESYLPPKFMCRLHLTSGLAPNLAEFSKKTELFLGFSGSKTQNLSFWKHWVKHSFGTLIQIKAEELD